MSELGRESDFDGDGDFDKDSDFTSYICFHRESEFTSYSDFTYYAILLCLVIFDEMRKMIIVAIP